MGRIFKDIFRADTETDLSLLNDWYPVPWSAFQSREDYKKEGEQCLAAVLAIIEEDARKEVDSLDKDRQQDAKGTLGHIEGIRLAMEEGHAAWAVLFGFFAIMASARSDVRFVRAIAEARLRHQAKMKAGNLYKDAFYKKLKITKEQHPAIRAEYRSMIGVTPKRGSKGSAKQAIAKRYGISSRQLTRILKSSTP